MVSKSKLAIFLSQLHVFTDPDIMLEQYPTDSEIAADIIHFATLQGDIQDKVIADFGCGTGILGIAALVSGAKHVYFIDKDPNALDVLKRNLSDLDYDNYTIINNDVKLLGAKEFSEPIDVVVQNPPFGTRDTHADRAFLEAAFAHAPIIYTFHKTSTKRFVDVFTTDNKARITHTFPYEFPLKRVYEHHKRNIHRVAVSVFRIEK